MLIASSARSLERFTIALAFLCSILFAPIAHAQQPYKVIDHWKVGGTGGWDYLLVDTSAHLLYLTHGPRVEVLDTQTGKSVGAITGLKGTHGIALDAEGKYGYVSDGAANNVVVFDRKTFASITTIPTGTNPDGIIYEPVTKTVWVFNGRSSDATVIDTAKKAVVATIKLGGKPEFPAVDGMGNVFVNIETTNSMSKLDAKTRTLTATWKLPTCESPSGLAIDTAHGKLFPVCDGKKMAVIDAATGKTLASPAIGDGPDAAGFSIKNQVAFASAGDGTLTVVSAAAPYKVLQTIATEPGARTMAYDESTDRVYLVYARYGAKPEATTQTPRPRAPMLPDSFSVLVVGRK